MELVKARQNVALQIALRFLVPPARFQRATFRLGGGRSMQLNYINTFELPVMFSDGRFGISNATTRAIPR